MSQVNVTISPTGDVKVEAANVQGAGCSALTQAIEAALGRTTADQKKPEYFQQQTNTTGVSHGQNNTK